MKQQQIRKRGNQCKNRPKNNLYNKKEVTQKTRKLIYERINHLECIVFYIVNNPCKSTGII